MSDQEYFTVHHKMTVNVEPLAQDGAFPSYDQFESEIPAPFLVASEFSHLDLLNDNARAELKNNDFRHVIELLDTQNAKLNLLLTFMLSQQDDEQYRHQTLSFGASKFSYTTNHRLELNTKARVKMFMEHPSAAIYCYGHVESCQTQDDQYIITIKYDLLRDQDEDLLIKAALYQQQKLLRQRSLNRDKQ
ncbi:PilZ domain-containing protein [Vibrio sp. Isolate23]|uniref:PilZ domain-containing protein n=1 Tax=Vibrio sp. Isolate23 TaxID=2908533 RepID=UPI001EFC7526|nr:PilZ domain-containing protein [Vibrio sp. Isolate23]MCG9683200.1 PilZ domain-containing protein [Vibrio sp. Isolate23]